MSACRPADDKPIETAQMTIERVEDGRLRLTVTASTEGMTAVLHALEYCGVVTYADLMRLVA